jgi:hypothetical protein
MPIFTTPDLCFVLHNDDGKGGYKIGRGEKETWEQQMKGERGSTTKKESLKNKTLFFVKSFVPKTSPDACFEMTTLFCVDMNIMFPLSLTLNFTIFSF